MMNDRIAKNPLRVYFGITKVSLLCTLAGICMRFMKAADFSEAIRLCYDLGILYKLVVACGCVVFIYFYVRGSFIAWYALVLTLFLILPLLFMMDIPGSSRISSTQILIVVLICWSVALLSVVIKYLAYKEYINDGGIKGGKDE